MANTVTHYEENALSFYSDTVGVDMTELYEPFLLGIPKGGLILDAGCGSGRDSRAFLDAGYRVHAFDASPKLATLAAELIRQPVATQTFDQVSAVSTYDGIWACASLLHLPEADLKNALSQLWMALKPGGTFYLSFKHGEGERQSGGRHFTDATENRLHAWLKPLDHIETIKLWLTEDKRPGRREQWVNAIVRRAPAPREKLIVGGNTHPFLPALQTSIASATEIDFAVAFVKTTGLRLLLPDLQVALSHGEEESHTPVRVRFLTSDYLDVTDPDALRHLMLLQAQGAQIRVFQTAGSSFHLKAYLFTHQAEEGALSGTAFIGSSNISRQALTDGLEWNYRVTYPTDDGFLEARNRFEELFRHPSTVELTDPWIDRYEARRVPPQLDVAPGSGEKEAPPNPTPIQVDALQALAETRAQGYSRGLVVLATGLGKTWLAAFDAQQLGARRVLFIAHREEILNQAAETFLRIRPSARVGFYQGQTRDTHMDILCASVQTLGREEHLTKFTPQHFDYIVVDEFHHAAAPTYRKLLMHFAPQFLLGLTATPDRTDQSDILTFCDDNLVYSCNLFDGISANLLAPFHYFGIWDESVNYKEIPWRNGRFDPEQLTNKLATLARARHALKQWKDKAQKRTLAFCVSIRHAEYMAEQFRRDGISAQAVYAGSTLGRSDSLAQLADGRLQVIFSVDLFSEGVDLPSIDTVLLLRPTESKILFLQQLGRGLRRSEGKEKLVVLDFIGNHQGFLHKPQSLAQIGASFRELADFARKAEAHQLSLPAGCFINYDLEIINFLKSLGSTGIADEYLALKATLGRRPSLSEFYRSGANVRRVQAQYGSWFGLVKAQEDLHVAEIAVVEKHQTFLRELEVTQMTRSYKMVLLEAFQEVDGWRQPPSVASLAQRSRQVIERRRALLSDLPPDLANAMDGLSPQWIRYWRDNPVNAWIGGNTQDPERSFFKVTDDQFLPTLDVSDSEVAALSELVQELIDYRLASYERRQAFTAQNNNVIPFTSQPLPATELPFFPDLKIACGHFRTASAEVTEHRRLGSRYGQLDPARHFIARAKGNSMDGGKNPIRDGDYLLLELVNPSNAGSITGSVMAIERQDEFGDNQYLLRNVHKKAAGAYVLKANNPDYQDMDSDDSMRTLARLKDVIDPLDLIVGQAIFREDIPPLFGEEFNPGNWNVGHVTLPKQNAVVLLVTINKQGRAEDHRYVDHWIDERTFHWQSQAATTPDSARGKQIIQHAATGVALHLFVREHKLSGGKGAPFTYFGKVNYKSHSGSAPMSVIFELAE